MSDPQSRQKNVISPVVIMLAGLVLLAGSVASFLMVNRGEDRKPEDKTYRGIIFEAVAPSSGDGELGARLLLMGSLHVLRPDDYPLPASYEKAFELADSLAFELKPGEMDRKAESVKRHTTYDDGSKMRDHLSEPLFFRASSVAERAGLSMESLEYKRPHVLAQALSGGVLARAGFKRNWGVDAHFRSKASAAGKVVLGFETLEEQLSVFSSLNDARQEALLLHTLDEMERHADYGIRGMRLWKAGDIEGMADLSTNSRTSDPELGHTLFEQRHARWLPEIERLLAPGKTLLVVVGAAHLCGEGSLVDLLRERGYAIEQW